MTYHRNLGGLGQDMTFSLTDPDVAAMQAPTTTTATPAPTGGKTSTSTAAPTSGGKSGPIISSWAPQPSGTPITSAAYAAPPPADGSPHWMPWAIGGAVAVLGLGLIFAARS